MDWPVLVLVAIAIALAGIGVWWWLQRRTLADEAPDEAPAATEPVAIPVGEPESASVAVAVVPTPTKVAAVAAAPAKVAATPAEVPATAMSASGPSPDRITRTADPAHPFGPGSAAPRADGGGPTGWAVKGNADSGLYHTPSSPSWKRMKAEAWFEDEAAAEAAGFTRWDWRRNAS